MWYNIYGIGQVAAVTEAKYKSEFETMKKPHNSP